jgi:hypothetical protein
MSSDSLQTIEQLRSGESGGVITLNVEAETEQDATERYQSAISKLRSFDFWLRSENAPYRPDRGLWLPQRRAIAFANAYLSVTQTSGARPNDEAAFEAALIKMPTGTGKTAVIAALACASPLVSKTLIITPRVALVRQMKFDLSYRFWEKLDAIYFDGKVHEHLESDMIGEKREQIRNGKIAPVRVLAAEQYQKIHDERGHDRQIWVSTFNALHRILGLNPPHTGLFTAEKLHRWQRAFVIWAMISTRISTRRSRKRTLRNFTTCYVRWT